MKKVVVCVLDWGLGHATRMVPVVRMLKKYSVDVVIASSGSALDLLRIEFPENEFLTLPGYSPRYGSNLMMYLMKQVPSFLEVIRKEREMLAAYAAAHPVDAIISDNRYGCHVPGVKSVFIGHQLQMQLSQPLKTLQFIPNRVLRNWVESFDEVWVPDDPVHQLTEPWTSSWRGPVRWIGWLSRFSTENQASQPATPFVGLASGPEPHREAFADKLIRLLSDRPGSVVICGVPGQPSTTMNHARVYGHLPSYEMEVLLRSANLVIARCGYSTVMDLIALRKPAVLVPTPGQPEQELLSECINTKGFAEVVREEDLEGVDISRLQGKMWPTASSRPYELLESEIKRLLI